MGEGDASDEGAVRGRLVGSRKEDGPVDCGRRIGGIEGEGQLYHGELSSGVCGIQNNGDEESGLRRERKRRGEGEREGGREGGREIWLH